MADLEVRPSDLMRGLAYLRPGVRMESPTGEDDYVIRTEQLKDYSLSGKTRRYNFRADRYGNRQILAAVDEKGGVWVGPYSPWSVQRLIEAGFQQDADLPVPLSTGERPANAFFHTV